MTTSRATKTFPTYTTTKSKAFKSVRLELASQYFRIIICDVGEAPTLRIRGAKESFKTFVNSRDNCVNIPVDEEVRMFLSPKTAA